MFLSLRSIDGNIVIAGTTRSENFPTTTESSFKGGLDAFVVVMTPNGALIWSTYLGGVNDENFNRFGLLFHDLGVVYISGITKSPNLLEVTHEEVGFVINLDDNGNVKWIKGLTPEARISPNRDNGEILDTLIVVGLISMGVFSLYFGFDYFGRRKKDSFIIDESVNKILSPIFNKHTSLLYIFAAEKIVDDAEISEVQDSIPNEIISYKYLLQPVRLSIIKLLEENVKLTTVQIKDMLQISWKEVTTHLQSLESHEYVTIEKAFVDGSIRTVVSAEAAAIKRYKSLREVLMDFLDATPNLDRYLEVASDVRQRHEYEELYPEDN